MLELTLNKLRLIAKKKLNKRNMDDYKRMSTNQLTKLI